MLRRLSTSLRRPQPTTSRGLATTTTTTTTTTNNSSNSSNDSSFDTVIMGGGAVGASVAYQLSLLAPHMKIAVIERDNTYRICSSMLSAASIRQQFSVPENIKMSSFGIKFIKDLVKQTNNEIQFHEIGYLFLGSAQGRRILLENNRTQHESGATWIKLLERPELASRFPWLNLDGIDIGSYGLENEGYFDPWAYVNILKRGAIERGVKFINGEVYSGRLSPVAKGSVSSFELSSVRIRNYSPSPSSSSSSSSSPSSPSSSPSQEEVKGKWFVNASGAWAGMLLDRIIEDSGLSNKSTIARLPVVPRKRCIFTVHCALPSSSSLIPPPPISPLTIDPSGVYFRPEGKGERYICGVSPPEHQDPDCLNDSVLDSPDHHLFEETIWPVLASRVPAFEALKVKSSWAGFYDHNKLDQVR